MVYNGNSDTLLIVRAEYTGCGEEGFDICGTCLSAVLLKQVHHNGGIPPLPHPVSAMWAGADGLSHILQLILETYKTLSLAD